MESVRNFKTSWVMRLGVFSLALLGVMASGRAIADQIRLKDGKEFDGAVMGKDSESVVIRVPRADVDTINGKPLPAAVGRGANAPQFEAVDLTGAKQALAVGHGRPILLQFWASWCPHCRRDVPLLKDLLARYRDKGLQLLTVSIDQDLSKLQSFVRDQNLPYPVIAAYQPEAKALSVPELYEVQGIPAYYLIDGQGTITQTFAGEVSMRQSEFESALSRLFEAAGNPSSQASKERKL